MRHTLPARFSVAPGLSAAFSLVPAVALPLILGLVLTAIFIPAAATAQEHPAHRTSVELSDRTGFGPGRYVLADGLPMLTDNNYSIPHVCDWNADGAKDLLVGVFFEGNVYLFLNQGTDESPVFGEGTLLAADGEPISVGYG